MSRKCRLSGKAPLAGNNVSHANNKTRRRQLPNLQWKRLYVAELKRFVRIRLSNRMLRTIDKKGLMPYLKENDLTLKDVI